MNGTGRERISWKYFDAFENIYFDDRSVCFPPTIGSTRITKSNTASVVLSTQQNSNPFTSQYSSENFLPTASTSEPSSSTFASSEPISPQPCFSKRPLSQLPISTPLPPTPQPSIESSPNPCNGKISKRTDKSSPMKNLYQLRQRQIDIEERRVQELQLLRQGMERSNKLQEERNELCKEFLQQLVLECLFYYLLF
ncbi:hypothetical protein MML48_1g00942 [Holotrichia oblita]|uniref:Uncharacterized protein n=1 Tax=Holotrichia oblita TaxID=644536 RepID=A0ACB9TSD9_HOLOL|nr:hypothetical protein MML48_1g00942 [Holotrichia oblita]